MSDLYKTRWRGYLVDHHSPPPPVVDFSSLDIYHYEQFYRQAHINSLMVYCKDHWGYSYYDTSIGVRHPALEGDWLARQTALLKELDIEFNAYYCMEYDNLAPQMHPEWATRKADGSILRCEGRTAKWRMPCYMTGYRDYAIGQLKEIVQTYRPDSFFFDIFGKSLCYCDSCRSDFFNRNGFHLPETAEGLRQHHHVIIRYLDDRAEDFLDEIRSELSGIDPALPLTVNFSAHYPERIRKKLDYHFTEPWAGNWYSGAFAEGLCARPQLGPGNVSRIFDYLPPSVYQLAAAEIAAQNCRVFFFSEPQLPDGTLEEEEAMRIGAAFHEIAPVESFLPERKRWGDIILLYNDESLHVGMDGRVEANAIARARADNRFTRSILGAMQTLDRTGFTWQVVTTEDFLGGRGREGRVLVLANLFHISPDLVRGIEDFASRGGSVIITGESGLYDGDETALGQFAFSDIVPLHFKGFDARYRHNSWGGYAEFADLHRFSLPRTTPPLPATSVDYAAETGTVARYVAPAVELTDETWVNWGYPPPGIHTERPIISEFSVGKGRLIYCGFDLFGMVTDDTRWPSTFFNQVLNEHAGDFSIRLDHPYGECVRFTALRRNNELMIHQVSTLPHTLKGDAPPVEGGVLTIRKDISSLVRAERLYPEGSALTPLPMEGEKGIRVSLEPFTLSALYRFTFRKGVL